MLLLEEPKETYKAENRSGRLNPLNDYLFKQYMGTEEYKICLISFLQAVLEISIADITIIENLELPQETPEGKFSRLDVRAKLQDGTQINIEVQLQGEGNIVKRSQYYNGRLFVAGINGGDNYKELGKVISINILDFNCLPFPEFHISSHFRIDQHPEQLLSQEQEIHFIELRKFYKERQFDINNPLHRWLSYFNRDLEENILKELIHMDGAIAAAEERTLRVAASEKEMRYYEAMEDARRNMISSMNYQWEQGYKEGEAQLAALMKRLLQDNRMEDLQRAITDAEARELLFKEYGIR